MIYVPFICDSVYSSSIISSKIRVTPIKELTIPKLVLEAFLLLAKVNQSYAKVQYFDILNNDVACFTDSKVILSWLSKPRRTEKFVANRVARTVVKFISSDLWKHAPDF